MKLTTRGHYSVKALLDLSLQQSNTPVSVKEIAVRQDIPATYLEKLLIETVSYTHLTLPTTHCV